MEDGQDLRESVDALRSQLQFQGEELVARRRQGARGGGSGDSRQQAVGHGRVEPRK